MKTKIKKLLFEHSRNSRATTKELGKLIGASQQSVSYLLNTLKKKKLLWSNATRVDAIKLGFINVTVGFNFLNPKLKKEIIEELISIPSVTSIEEGRESLDLLVEYTIQNLSSFNKIHSELIYKFYKKLKTVFVLPTIVTHEYHKNYLSRKEDDEDIILFGDRIVRDLSEKELSVLDQLIKNPEKKIIDISSSLNMPAKSVVRIKKSLEKKYIIKGYTSILNHRKLNINREIIFLRFSSEGTRQIEKFVDFAKYNKNIIRLMKVIGEYQIVIFVESLKDIEIIKTIRENFPIENYRIVRSEKIHKKKYTP